MYRDWVSALLRASGAGVIVPVALVVALLVSTSVGGRGMRGLGQLFEGPAVPAATAAGVHGGPGAPPHIPEPAEGAVSPREPIASPRRAAYRQAAQRERRRSAAVKRRGARRIPVSRPPGPSQQAPRPDPSSPPPSDPPPRPDGPVRSVGKAVTGTVRPLPVVGEPVADAVQTVVDLVEPPPRPRTDVATPARPSARGSVREVLAP